MSLTFTGAGAFATAPRGDYDSASLTYAENMLQRTGSYQSVSQATRIPVPVLRALCQPPKPRAPFRLLDAPKPIPAKPARPKTVRAKRAQKGSQPPAEPCLTVSEIKQAVAKRYGVSVEDIESKSKRSSVILPRQVSMWLCRSLTSQSFPEIARRHGNRDHTTAIHTVGKINARMADEEHLAKDIETIRRRLLLDLLAKKAVRA